MSTRTRGMNREGLHCPGNRRAQVSHLSGSCRQLETLATPVAHAWQGLTWWWSSPSRFSACSTSASSHCCPAAVFWFELELAMMMMELVVLLVRRACDPTALDLEDQDQGGFGQ